MALQGNLRDFSITQLLNLIHIARKSGTLTIQGPNEMASLAFLEGRMIYGQRGHEDGRLVPVLRYNQLLTEEQATTLLARPEAGNDKELGLLLIQASYVSQQTILQAIQKYLVDLVNRLFTWSEGMFQFYVNVLPPEDRITVRLDLENMIMEGARRMREWERLQDEIPDLDLALKFTDRPDARLRNINLSVEEWRVVSYISPKNTMHQIARANRINEMELRRIVYGLMQAGVVEIMKPEGAPPPPAFSKIQPMPKTPEQAGLIRRIADRIRSI
jgi:hypothetical protein